MQGGVRQGRGIVLTVLLAAHTPRRRLIMLQLYVFIDVNSPKRGIGTLCLPSGDGMDSGLHHAPDKGTDATELRRPRSRRKYGLWGHCRVAGRACFCRRGVRFQECLNETFGDECREQHCRGDRRRSRGVIVVREVPKWRTVASNRDDSDYFGKRKTLR